MTHTKTIKYNIRSMGQTIHKYIEKAMTKRVRQMSKAFSEPEMV
ncbi:hypothetical protein [Drancourtella massiliensis]|nr:hypothetical protein [Drancourtella massiliensis]